MTDSFVPDRPVICPYDGNHSIAQSRFQRHIIKCSKNFPPNYRLCCPYNATHRLPKSEMKNHVDVCPDKRFLDPIVYEGLSNRGSVASFEMEDRSIIHCDETWDEEDGTLYDLSSIRDLNESTHSQPIARVNSHAPSSEMPAMRIIEPQTTMRPPRGWPEVLMMEESGDSAVEDIESVTSFMCMGRGKPIANRNNEHLEMIGRGRGAAP